MGFKLEPSIPKSETNQSLEGLDRLLKKEIVLFGKGFGNTKKEHFYTELGVLVKAGIHLREALQILSENQKKKNLTELYQNMVEDLDAGQSFYQVLRKRRFFTEYECYSVQIGEESGRLDEILEELGSFFGTKNQQRKQLINALTYPAIIFATAFLVVVFMLRMVVPMFEDIFSQNQVKLPVLTRWIIAASHGIEKYGLLALLLLAGGIVSFRFFLKNEAFQAKKDAFLLKLPIWGPFIKCLYLAQFTQAMHLLTTSKVPMIESVKMTRKMIGFHPLKQALSHMESRIISGDNLAESVKDIPLFDAKMASLMKVAEETNQTEYIFERLQSQYRSDLQQKSKLLSTLMEPVIIVFVGAFVGVILVSMYLPMFQLSSVLG